MSIANFCDVMALLRKAPRTVLELVQVTGISRGAVQAYIDALHDEGHIRIASRPNKRTVLYAWQDVLFGTPDEGEFHGTSNETPFGVATPREFETSGPIPL